MSALAQQIAEAIRTHQPLPAFPDGLSLADGYEVQLEVASLVAPGGFAGIKAGITSEQLQAVFGIDHALLGRLYRHGHLKSGATLPFIEKQLIECEIGITVDAEGQPVSAGLALEFAFAAFSSPTDATAPNLIAGNVAADMFLTGEQHPWRKSYDDIIIRFYRDDELINEAPITESLGGPANAVTWIVQEAKRYDIEIPDGTLLMTGACGQVIPASPGTYRADYGDLGEVNFTITG
jgi:2-keto-4-pentenoate hydratase